MDTKTLFKSLAILESVKLMRKESFHERLLKGWRGEFEFYKITKKEEIPCIEGPWILRPRNAPKRFVLYFHIGDVGSFPKHFLDLKSPYLIPFVLCASIQEKLVVYPPKWYVTRSGMWKLSTKRPSIISVKYEVYNAMLSHVATLGEENFQPLSIAPFEFPLTKRSRFFRYDEEYVEDVVTREKNSLEIDFLETLYAKRFFVNYILSAFSFVEIGDLDAVLLLDDKKFIVEIKEKFPIPQTQEFGWDAHRMVPFFFWQREMDAKVVYCIREVVSETDRSFRDWKLIDLDKFLLLTNYSVAISGSAGAFGGGRTTTLQVPVDQFYSLSRESLRSVLSKM